jgi:hypothetical protein
MHDAADGHRAGDGLDDHPDLADLRWSSREVRRVDKRARPPRTRPGAAFLRRHRVKLVSIGGLIGLLAVGAVFVGGIDRADTRGETAAVDLERPFLGTPVARWPEGAAGIVAPSPTALGEYTAAEVTGAYAAVRQLLVTARLDPAVIVERDVEPYIRLLAPAAQPAIRDEIAQDPIAGYGHVTRISDDFRLLPVQPRVRGWMRAELDPDGALLVRTDYVVAYAFHIDEPKRLVHAMEHVAVERLAMDVVVSDDRWPPARRGLWPRPVKGYAYSMACTPYDRGVLAPAYSERTATGGDVGGAEDRKRMFDPNLPMPTGSGCPA